MIRLVLILALAVPLPAFAQDDGNPSLMERGAKMFFRGLMEEMEPAMRDLQGLVEEAGPAMQSFMQEMGPAFADVLSEIKDFSVYHPPEILPNGDIIMRRREPLDPDPVPEIEEGEEIEL